MARVKSPQLRQLLLQAKFAPESKRLAQIDACEALIGLNQPNRRYPFEFICFHLTGYRPHPSTVVDSDNSLTYNDLLADIPAYAVGLSKTLQIPVSSLNQKVYTTESLARRLRVCRKTITRWRRNGLMGRYLLFADGRLRLGFPASSVDYYIRKNRRKVLQSKNFSQISDAERQGILRRLARWARRCPNHRQEAIHRTARRFGRSVESVRSLLTQAETNSYADINIQFTRRPYSIEPQQCREIFDLYQQGVAVADLMKQFGRSKSNIYRAINLAGVTQLLDTTIAYIPSDEFTGRGSNDYILHPDPKLFDADTANGWDRGSPSKPYHKGPIESLTAYVQDIYRTGLLDARQEKFLFRKYNYLKFLAAQSHQRLDRGNPSGRLIRQIRLYLLQAQEVKDRLIRSNLRLVVSVARRHTRNDAEMLELISEGNLVLINAVEKFDFTRGTKLSTYVTWSIVKRYATLRATQSRTPVHQAGEDMLEVAQDLRLEDSRVLAVESARKSLDQVMSETLDQRERTIVREHYGLIRQTEISGQRKPRSLSQIAKLIGLSKERVRQIELFALQKLRRVLTREQFDLLTG
jgi:RNA polymerase sigma factor (sigma-70 family)